MRKSFNLIILLVLALVLIFAPVIRTEAQDGGATTEEQPTVLVENQTDFDAVFGVVAALAGVLIGGGSMAVILGRANQSKQLKDSTEKLLADLVPQKTVDGLNDLARGTQQLAHYLATQFEFPGGVPSHIAKGVQAVAGAVEQGAQFVGDVSDGQTNTVSASFSSSKGIPPRNPAA